MRKEQIRLYQTKEWYTKCEQIFQRDNYTCMDCGRTLTDRATLQVHHFFYVKECNPWEYPNDALITLCSRCHAERHKKIMPSSDWVYDGVIDTEEYGSLECEYCNENIRYAHILHHPQWGVISVGCVCAEKLLQKKQPNERQVEMEQKAKRIEMFMNSPKWKRINDNHYSYKESKKLTYHIWVNPNSVRVSYQTSEEGYKKSYFETEPLSFPNISKAKHFILGQIKPELQEQTPQSISNSSLIEMNGSELNRILYLRNICLTCLKNRKKINLPAYKTIPPRDLFQFSDIKSPIQNSSFPYDLEGIVIKNNKRYSFFIKFLFKNELTLAEKDKIQNQNIQYITIDCSALLDQRYISQNKVEEYIMSGKHTSWIRAFAYDEYLRNQNND